MTLPADPSTTRGGRRATEPRPSSPPLVSVIVPVLNRAPALAECLASVLCQDCPGVELIVLDGGSTDGTLDVLRRHDDRVSLWVSEPDLGIYDAMNKGVDASTGEWLYFLGSDDRLASPGALSAMLEGDTAQWQVLMGSVVDEQERRFVSRLGTKTLLVNTVHHQSVLYRRSLFRDFRYGTGYRVLGDYELNLRVLMTGTPVLRRDVVVARCAGTGVSHGRSAWSAQLDLFRMRRDYVGLPLNLMCLAAGLVNRARRGLFG
ncbi:MAG: glycosyltransferase [Elusimicrobia bacterium]|nr:glycosyltransferase [Elusimicrobiota bacterium]